jgi:putative FmdB family regulatory protein
MPTYDYVCHHCGHRFEVVHGVHEDGPKSCPVCHSNEVRKAIATPAVHFKGSGWAKKDRSSSSRSAAAKKDEAASKTGGSADASGSSGATTGSDASGSSTSSSSAAGSTGD